MNALDIVIAILIGGASVYGLARGFVRIATGIAGLALTLAFSLRLAGSGPKWFGQLFASDHLARIAAFILVFVIGLLLTGLVAFLAHKLVKTAQLSWLDRLLGGGIGFAGSTLVVCGLLVGMTAFMPPGASLLRSSALLPYAIVVSDAAAVILPPELAEIYRQRRDSLAFTAQTEQDEPQQVLSQTL